MSNSTVSLHDKTFELFISEEEILSRVKDLGFELSQNYDNKEPLFLGVLNGAFMFASDLMKHITIPAEISFIKVASYQGMSSQGQTKELLGLNVEVKDRHILVVEDIVDSGVTMESVINNLKSKGAASIEVVSLLVKPECLEKDIHVKYLGFEIPEKFVVGYGLDYNGLGRNLKDIYQLKLD